MRKDFAWNLLGTSAWSFVSLLLLIIVTRINGLTHSGLFSFAFAFALIMYTVGCYGGRTYQVSDHNNKFVSDNYIAVRLFTSIAVVFITLLFVLINGYDWYKSMLIFLLVGHRVFDAIADVFYGILQKSHHLYIAGISLFYKSLLSLILFFIIDVLTGSLLFSALALPLVSMVFVLFYDIPQSRKLDSYTNGLNFSNIKEILRATFSPFIITAMGLVFVNLARYFVDIYHPDLQGYFGIIIMPLSFVILLFSFVLTPSILHLTNRYHANDIRALHHTVVKIIGVISFVTLLLCPLVYYLGAPLLHILFGIEFGKYVLDVMLVIIIGWAIALITLFTNIAIIARGLWLTAFIYLLSLIILGLLCVLFVDQYSIRGAIIAYIVSSVILAMLMGIYYLYLTSFHKLSKNL